MSDQSYISHVHLKTPPKRTPRAEYATYFGLILILALPVQCLVWLGSPPHEPSGTRSPGARAARRRGDHALDLPPLKRRIRRPDAVRPPVR